METKVKKIAFVVDVFPVISETWLINQVAYLQDQGIEIKIFSFRRKEKKDISEKFYQYNMEKLTYYIDMPEDKLKRIFVAIPKAIRMGVRNPKALFKSLNFKKYGRQALSLQLLFWAEPFIGDNFDLYHCHHGTTATQFLEIKHILDLKEKMVTTFYGQDVSRIFKMKGDTFYDELKKECSTFIVMSEFMKKRLVAKGFDEKTMHVIPIFGIDASSYPFKERTLEPNEPFQMVSVGRFVGKKGFDDLLRAVSIIKDKKGNNFNCNIIGDGPLGPDLHKIAKDLDVEDVVSFKGTMKVEEIINYFLKTHLYLQPSKTASNGDME